MSQSNTTSLGTSSNFSIVCPGQGSECAVRVWCMRTRVYSIWGVGREDRHPAKNTPSLAEEVGCCVSPCHLGLLKTQLLRWPTSQDQPCCGCTGTFSVSTGLRCRHSIASLETAMSGKCAIPFLVRSGIILYSYCQNNNSCGSTGGHLVERLRVFSFSLDQQRSCCVSIATSSCTPHRFLQ